MTNTIKNVLETGVIPTGTIELETSNDETLALSITELKRIRDAFRVAAHKKEIAEITQMIRNFRMRGAQ